jgi:tetratricopeptide (TPR) repeat protein
MKKVRILIVGISAVLVVLLASVFSEAVDKPQVRIWVEKDQFFVHEPILVHYEIKNTSDSTLFLDVLREEHFVITDKEGKRYESHLKGTDMGVDHLRPGETRRGLVNISGLYGVVRISEYSCYLDVAPPGQIYPPQYERTKSNTIKIKVIEPEGEEKKALDMFLEAERLKYSRDKERGGRDLKKAELGFLKYQEVVDKYPNSVYAPLALSSAWGTYRYSQNLEDTKKNIPVYKRLIESYPNSHYVASAFCGLVETYENFKDKSGAIQSMKELIKKHPNTQISERAEYWLEKIEKWEFK